MSPTLRSGLMFLGVFAAIGIFTAGFLVADSGGGGRSVPDQIESIVPSHQAIISPQGTVGVDLANTHTGVLLINGAEVPLDQLTRVEPLSQVYFSPGAGKNIERFEAGLHSVTVVYWPKSESRADSSSFTWQFRVGS